MLVNTRAPVALRAPANCLLNPTSAARGAPAQLLDDDFYVLYQQQWLRSHHTTDIRVWECSLQLLQCGRQALELAVQQQLWPAPRAKGLEF